MIVQGFSFADARHPSRGRHLAAYPFSNYGMSAETTHERLDLATLG